MRAAQHIETGRGDASTGESSQQARVFPASLGQQRFWVLDQIIPGNPAYNIAVRFRLEGPLDCALMERVWNEIVRRHEVLRATFAMENGGLCQLVAPHLEIKVPMVDLSNLSPKSREAEAERLASLEARGAFNLAVAPLIRVSLLRLEPQQHVLLVTVHHTACDDSSVGIMMHEVAVLYDALGKGRIGALPELPIQYADFTRWQKDWVESDALAPSRDYWQKQLADLPVFELPTDRSRSSIQNQESNIVSFAVSRAVTEALKELSTQNGCTVFMTFLATFAAMLHRYTNGEDIVVGSPIAGRDRFEVKSLIGMFVNTLVLRMDASGDPTFIELLKRVEKVVIDALAHQAMPFEKLVEILRPKRDLSRNPLFQINFTVQQDFVSPQDLAGATLTAMPSKSPGAVFDIQFFMVEEADGWRASCEYNLSMYDQATAARMLKHFGTMLESVAANPHRRISELPILSDDEKHQVLYEWNATDEAYPKEKCVHELFEAQAKRTPHSLAVTFGKDALTYAQLNQRSDRIAAHLRARGAKPGALVALCVERSAEMVVGLLGILKSGAAYVPLDPAYPEERLAFMLKDAQPRILLTQSKILAELPKSLLSCAPGAVAADPSACRPEHSAVICLDALPLESERAVGGDRPRSADLAYVIYTSGSTGKPKGVQITHQSVVNFLMSMRNKPGMTDKDVLLAVTTLSFDIAGLELFLPLTVGARVEIASHEVAADGRLLSEFIETTNATIMQATPATWQMLLTAGWQGNLHMKILCGGEALTVELAAKLLSKCGALWNMYGPTETTIWSSIQKVEPGDEAILLGRPIANTRFYVLDSHLQPVPIGVAGELHIGGDGLAKGYLNWPELTAERFVNNPFTQDPTARMYKTGDLVRYRADGQTEFLGRLDQQVKLRGYRIELGEIEEALRAHPEVRQAVVIAKEGISGDKRLIAYVLQRGPTHVSANQLRDYLKNNLPQFMVPSAFITLESFPLTPNGKVDRKRLPEPGSLDLGTEKAYLASRDDLELQLAGIWQKVLGVKRVGITDDFFELGGHSLLAVQLFVEIEKEIHKKLPLATLFRASTVEGLANVIRNSAGRQAWRCLVQIRDGGSKEPLFFIHGAEGNVLLYRQLAKHMDGTRPVYGLQALGLDGKTDFPRRFEDIASLYIQEIRSVQPEGPYYLGGYCLGGTLALEMAQQMEKQGATVALVSLLESYNIQTLPRHTPGWMRACRGLQNLMFHAQNIAASGSRNCWAFFKEKMQVSIGRMRLRLAARSQPEDFAHLLVTEAMDRAEEEYVPKPYIGRVALFRPRTYFLGQNDGRFGWGDVLNGRLEVYVLPFYPKGMLVEPFVRILAKQLERAQNGPAIETL